MKKIILLSTLFCIAIFPAQKVYAQLGDLGEIVRAGKEDANILMENYLKPYTNGFGADLNSGWNNTAKPYSTLGFDVRINGAFAIVPSSDEIFDVAELEEHHFQELELLSSSGISPTVAGDNVQGVEVGKTFVNPTTGLEDELFSFRLPGGTGFPFVPAPMVQATAGVINDTDVSLRFIPTVNTPDVDGQVSLFGFGAKHGVNQWLPAGTVLPVDLSVQFGYTQFNFDLDVDVDPESGDDIRNDYSPSNWDEQNIEMKSSGYTVNLLAGKSLPVVSIFGGLGFQSSTMDIKTNGSYPVTVRNPDHSFNDDTRSKAIAEIVDPINISVDGDNSIHGLAGFRFRFGVFAVSGSYTISNYHVANLGVGVSFR